MSPSTPDVRVVRTVGEGASDLTVIVPFLEGDEPGEIASVAPSLERRLSDAVGRKEVRSDLYHSAFFHWQDRGPNAIVIGAGNRSEFDAFHHMRVCAAASRYLTGRGYGRLAVLDRDIVDPLAFAQSSVTGILMGAYDAGIEKTEGRHRAEVDEITLVSAADAPALRNGAHMGRIIAEAGDIARDLVNLPPNELTPISFAERAGALARQHSLGFEALDEEAMRRLGMGSLLGVAAGSAQPPRLIVLRYGASDAAVRLALVGKGLTFDSGGLSLKTAEGMETMKGDMGGGAAVVAGMTAVARLAPANLSVTGYVGATENMPGGNAMRPGDILHALNGKTIEVLNTDAEGRLVLADVLTFACRQGATHVVDFATLTGGAVVALGNEATLATGRPSAWVSEVVRAAANGLERAWQMPLYGEYRRKMESDAADLKNTSGRWGSALTAAAFLSEFVDSVPWAHMDIAGTAWADKSEAFRPAGGTGEGVGTIVGLVNALSANDA